MAIELDYAFLAEWARAESDATVSAASAGLYGISLQQNELFTLYIAGRFTRDLDDGSHEMTMSFEGGEVSVSSSMPIEPAADRDRPGKPRIAFAIKLPLPITQDADCSVTLSIDGSQVALLPLQLTIRSMDDNIADA